MPEKKTLERARAKKRRGAAPSTQAGEFVREEIEHVEEGKHGVRSRKQAIAIGLSKARRAGVDLPPPAKGRAKPKTRASAARARAKGQAEGPLRSAAGGEGRTSARKAPARKPAARKASARATKAPARAGTSARKK